VPSFAAALDAWLTRSPPDGEELPLPGEPCDGNADFYDPPCGETPAHKPHTFVAHAWEILHRPCTKCGHDNTEVAA
jgi:hypothetical protein